MRNIRNALVFILASVTLVSFNANAQQKQIKDQAEYAAYMAALNEPDPAKKAAAMEAFVQQYPQSVVKVDALEQAMAGYQQSGNAAKVVATARRIVEVVPDHIRALAVLVMLDRAQATAGDEAVRKEECFYAERGIQVLAIWQKPEGTADADFAALRKQLGVIFFGGRGFCALQAKAYLVARDFYTKSVELDPTNLQDTYQLAVADLETTPIEVNGLWYCARAIRLAQLAKNSAAANSIEPYCKAKYKKYHGGDDGWDKLVAASEGGSNPPAGFAVKPAPTPAELAVLAVQQNKPEDLSFSDKEFILQFRDASPENRDAADKVWASIQALQKNGEARLEIPIKVISAKEDSIEAAIADDNRAAGKPDMHVIMEKPLLHPPAANSEIKIVGVITGYTLQPFMFTMEHGELPATKAR
jgi:hypothetical protein